MGKPTDCISVQEAKALQANWNSTRGVAGTDPCCFTINIDQLQEFIDYVRANSGTMNPGIRVYFAAYDDAKSDKATVFLCASDSDDPNSNNNYSVDPLNKNQGGWPPNAF